MTQSAFETGLGKNPANFQPLTPLTFLERSAAIFPERIAVIHGNMRVSYQEFYSRCRKLASALGAKGIGKGDTVSVMLSNTPSMLEVHYAVPMTGAVLHSMNTRLDASSIAFMLDHAHAKLVIADREFRESMTEALASTSVSPILIDYDDPEFPQGKNYPGAQDYEAFLQEGDPDYEWIWPDDEWDAISLNYTSGTTGNPKGVVYHHRGAHLMGYANVVSAGISQHPVYLWTLPMFHCNGWCFPWSICVVAGTHVCLRQVRSGAIWDALADHGVTHLCGAPIVMSTILNAPENEKKNLPQTVKFLTAAAPPPESVLNAMGEAGFDVVHLYGLTETYGPAVVNAWHGNWDELSSADRSAKKARQGVRYPALEGLSVRDPDTLEETPYDGETMGEVMFRGNIVMKGYLKNPDATEEAFQGGWFHSGDLGVRHPDGYIQLKDRSKDIIISGGENISSIEVENALYRHDAVAVAAVVARPDSKWGETPCAFVELNPGHENVTAEELISWCRDHLAHFKAPHYVVFDELPKTSTGKIQKFKLRDRAKSDDL